MKKVFLTLAGLLSLAVGSQAATLTLSCGVNLYAPNGDLALGSATRVCPNFNIAGQQLTGIQLTYGVDYTYSNPNEAPAISVTVNFNPVGTGLFTNDTINVTTSGLGNGAKVQNPDPAIGFQSIANVPNFFSGPSVAITPGTVSGPLDGFSASLFVTYTYSAIPPPPQGEIPEPSSMALLGAGLLGVGALARRRRS